MGTIFERLIKKTYVFGDMVCIFATLDGVTQFLLVPKGTENALNDEKLCCLSPLGHIIHREPMLHIALAGDGFTSDYSSGATQRNSDTAMNLRLISQTEQHSKEKIALFSVFENGTGLRIKNVIEYRENSEYLCTYNILENDGEKISLEAFPSFNLSAISPYDRFHDSEQIVLHKLISHWSGEGKRYSVTTDKLAFEPSWSGLGIRMEKWSQVGSMPARGQLPFVAVEDKKNGVTWAATMEAPASWIIETVFRNGNLSIGGGQGDYLTAHWRKYIEKGATFTTHKAYLTVAKSGLERVCERLISAYDADEIKEAEASMPVLYNEWCTSWGKPCLEQLRKNLPTARSLGCKYFVVDNGWFERIYGKETNVIGDWNVCREVFPEGLSAFSDEVASYGMIFGLWYEFERVSVCSDIYRIHPEWVLTYEGKPIIHQGKAFFDLRKDEVREYLREKVINNLKENRVGYLKVDYNDNIGLGTDGAESLGEGLRGQIEAVISFFEEIKRALPNLVLEICASGGMRHEAKFLHLADMVSFSDAHENASGVNVACNLHRYIPPRKLQIWATIKDGYTVENVKFTCAKAMLGRFCLSGNLAEKPNEILAAIKEATDYYQKISHIVREGRTTVIADENIKSYFRPQGTIHLIRESKDGKEKLVYSFAIDAPLSVFEFDADGFGVAESFNAPNDLRMENGKIKFTAQDCDQWGCVLHLVCGGGKDV